METIQLHGRHEQELAEEIARLVGSSLAVVGSTLTLATEDAEDAFGMAENARSYWTSIRHLAQAQAADYLRRKFFEIIACERSRRSFTK